MPPLRLIEDLLWTLSDDFAIGPVPPPSITVLERLAFPWWLDHLLRFNWINRSTQLRGYEMDATSAILDRPDLGRYIESMLFPIGAAANGDAVVIRYSDETAEVGMVSREEMGLVDPLVNHYFLVTPTLEEFLLRAVDRLYLPTDSFAARDFSILQASLRRPEKS